MNPMKRHEFQDKAITLIEEALGKMMPMAYTTTGKIFDQLVKPLLTQEQEKVMPSLQSESNKAELEFIRESSLPLQQAWKNLKEAEAKCVTAKNEFDTAMCFYMLSMPDFLEKRAAYLEATLKREQKDAPIA